ncbi:MAG: hypothetical protein ACREJU_09425 [Nitrospiraceae bacterium]
MKKRHIVQVSALIALVAGLPLASQGVDQNGNPDNSLLREHMVVPAGKVIDRDYIAYGHTVEISGTVNGDVYAVGGQVLIDGTINGDLLAAGGTVIISGTIAHDARLAGGRVIVSGAIGRNVTVAGANIEFTPLATIRGGIIAGGDAVGIAAPVTQNVKIGARNITVSDRIGGNLTAATETLRLTSGSAVTGNVTYWSRNPASVDDQAVVAGRIIRRDFPQSVLPSPEDLVLAIAGLKLGAVTVNFVSTLVVGLIAIRYYPASTQQALIHLTRRPFICLGVGLLALVLVPLVAIGLAVTIVGIPLAFILLAWYLVAVYVCRIVIILWAGLILFRRWGDPERARSAFVAGLLLYSFLTFVPILGALVALLVILFGLGTVLLAKRDLYRATAYQELV